MPFVVGNGGGGRDSEGGGAKVLFWPITAERPAVGMDGTGPPVSECWIKTDKARALRIRERAFESCLQSYQGGLGLASPSSRLLTH